MTDGPPEVEWGPCHVGGEWQWDGREHHRQHYQCQTDDAQDQVHFDQFAGELAQTKTARQAVKKTPVPSSIASKGAMEKIQLSNAHRTKMPSERQMTQALQATRLGVAEFRVVSAAQRMARYQPRQTATKAAIRSSCSRMRVKGSGTQCGVEALEHGATAEPGGDGPGHGQQWAEPQRNPFYLGHDHRSCHAPAAAPPAPDR